MHRAWRTAIPLLVATSMLLSAAGTVRADPPPLPSSFVGNVHVLKGAPGNGDRLYTYVDGVAGDTGACKIQPYLGGLIYQVDVHGDDSATSGVKEGGVDNDLVAFRLGGPEGRLLATGRWHSATNQQLDLHPPEPEASNNGPIEEGNPAIISVTATDWADDVGSYAFDCDGDGQYERGPQASGTLACALPRGLGTHSVGVRVLDGNGGEGIASTVVTVNNALPSGVNAGEYTAASGQPVVLAGTATCPPGDTCTYDWDLDGDEVFGDATGLTPAYTWYALGVHAIALRATDDAGASITGQGTITVTPADFRISLQPGWNLLSFNVTPSDPALPAVLRSIQDRYDLVYAWDAQKQAWLKWDNTGFPVTLHELTALTGFWLHVTDTAPATLVVRGTMAAATNVPLRPGWNLVGYPSATTRSLPAALADHGVGTNFSLVYAYHAGSTPAWLLFDRTAPSWSNSLASLTPGFGYWIKVSTASTWRVQR